MQGSLFAPASGGSSARFSPCGRYRYELRRDIPGATGRGTLPWVMINPSVADAVEDDLTIKKVLGFSARIGFASIVVVNLFALVSTDPAGLLAASDPVGPENDAAIVRAVPTGSLVVVAWGDSIKFVGRQPEHIRGRDARVLAMLREALADVRCLGTTKSGAPRHPSRLGYDTPIVPFGVK